MLETICLYEEKNYQNISYTPFLVLICGLTVKLLWIFAKMPSTKVPEIHLMLPDKEQNQIVVHSYHITCMIWYSMLGLPFIFCFTESHPVNGIIALSTANSSSVGNSRHLLSRAVYISQT